MLRALLLLIGGLLLLLCATTLVFDSLFEDAISCVGVSGLEHLGELLVVNAALARAIVVRKDSVKITLVGACGKHDAQLLNGTFELVDSDAALVLDVEELEGLVEEN